MAYMAQQWVTDQVRAAFRDRADQAASAVDEARRVRAWLTALGLDPSVTSVIDEPLAALEDGLRSAVGEIPRAPDAR